jgi:RNA polymerase sigma factor (sigma-70 family)
MEDTRSVSEETIQLERGIEQLNSGDPSVRGELLNIACKRLMRLTARLRRDFHAVGDVRSSEDVFQTASLRLYQALHDTPIHDVRDFYRLAAREIRRELIELCKYYQDRPQGSIGSEPSVDLPPESPERISPKELRGWALFHDSVEALPESQREVFELIWYHEMTRAQAAAVLEMTEQQVRRLWRAARLGLFGLLGSENLPEPSAGD